MSVKPPKRRTANGRRERSPVNSSKNSHSKEKAAGSSQKWGYMSGFGLSVTVAMVAWMLYKGYIETRINTPIAYPKMVVKSEMEVPEKYWGTYRPGVYFGTRVRHPLSPVTGLMWFTSNINQNNMAFRHWCDQGDDLSSYGWVKHDGINYGSQMIRDKKVNIKTDFVKKPGGQYGGDWSVRITVLPKNDKVKKEDVSLFYYVALDPNDTDGNLRPAKGSGKTLGSLNGFSSALGGFSLHAFSHVGEIDRQFYLSTKHSGLNLLKESVFKGLRRFQSADGKSRFVGLAGEVFDHDETNRVPNFVVFQFTAKVPFEVDIVFESHSVTRIERLVSDHLTSELLKYSKKFDERFDQQFHLKDNGFNEFEQEFAKAALSNMIGGIGYFYGSSKVQGVNNKDPVPYWKAPLYSAVPSRSFFPRGFLWDEGFHNLLISKWDRDISKDILAHWFDLINWDGWIPREQILGVEARARVPDEFVVQNMDVANPPTLLLTVHSMMKHFRDELYQDDYEFLSHLWPRIKAWYNWFNTTQTGSVEGTYRWRGRDPKAFRELNPKTFASGLDDYPRASHPSHIERHLDLRCWMTLASGLMVEIAKLIGKDYSRYAEAFEYLSDNQVLDALHWSYSANGYMDYGMHTNDVLLRTVNPNADAVRVVLSDPKPNFVDSFGYVSFFPLFLQIIDPQSSKLTRVLEDLKRPDLLWTEYGLRSLARSAPLYNKRNTQHDPPYWRGSIWINMNFLAVRALHHYSLIEGPNQNISRQLYKELRKNVIDNVISEYKRTGYLWEHYNDKTGRGEGCRPFTGWTALVVLMMGETY